MAETTRGQKSAAGASSASSEASGAASGAASPAPSPAASEATSDDRADGDPGDSRPGDGQSDRLSQSEARVAELEAELEAAKTTINALLEKAERRARSGMRRRSGVTTPLKGVVNSQDQDSSPGEPAAGDVSSPEKAPDARTTPVPGASPSSGRPDEDSNPGVTSKLDRIVRQRTRALAESEAQLQRKNIELQRLNEMKVEFISIATHELRTPLTSIVGYLDLMVEGRFGKMPESMSRPMASLRRNAHRLKHLVDEMLDVSRIDSGRITLYRRPCELGEIVNVAADALDTLLESKNLELSIDISASPRIHADADKIRRATSKLIANAVRHTPEGGKIFIAVDLAPPEMMDGNWARLRVKGDGEGIPLHLRSRIFEPFSDVNSARHHTSSGPDSAGLGLYIARGLIDLHGGMITVDSEEGIYTEFTVLLPAAESRIHPRLA